MCVTKFNILDVVSSSLDPVDCVVGIFEQICGFPINMVQFSVSEPKSSNQCGAMTQRFCFTSIIIERNTSILFVV